MPNIDIKPDRKFISLHHKNEIQYQKDKQMPISRKNIDKQHPLPNINFDIQKINPPYVI